MGTIKRDSLAITVLSYAGAAIGYVNKIILFPNFLSEAEFGLTGILLSLSMIYAQFSALGINSTVVKFFPFFRTPDRRHHGLFFWSALTVSIGFILFTGLFLGFREPVMHYFAKESPLLSQYYLLLIPFGLTTLFFNFFSSWLQALRKTVISTAAYDVILRLLLTLEISCFALGWLDFERFIVIYVLIHFVPTLILLLYTLYLRQADLSPRISGRTKKLIAVAGTYGLWQYLGGTSAHLTTVIDQTMLAGMKGLAQGAFFTAMVYLVSAMMIPHRSLVKVSTPIVVHLWKERDHQKMQRLQRKVSVLSLLIGCYLFMVIWVNLDNVFALMPASYSAGRYVFLFLGLARVFEMYAGLSGVLLVTSKRYRYDFSLSVLLVGLTVTSNALLIPSLGINGAAIATMTTVVIYTLLRIGLVYRFFGLHPFASKDLLVVILTGGIIGLCMLIPSMGNFIVDTLLRSLLVSVLFVGAVYRMKVSEEFNSHLEKTLTTALKAFRKP